jgi:hypothetical protein
VGGGDRGFGEIALLLGFSEPSAFSRAFRRWTGTTPKAFRHGRQPDAPTGKVTKPAMRSAPPPAPARTRREGPRDLATALTAEQAVDRMVDLLRAKSRGIRAAELRAQLGLRGARAKAPQAAETEEGDA